MHLCNIPLYQILQVEPLAKYWSAVEQNQHKSKLPLGNQVEHGLTWLFVYLIAHHEL